MSEKTKLSLEPYKGTRDFYPRDNFIQNYIFFVWRKVCESYGYLEYNASILEETELYKSKSGEEIVNEQTYSFIDRGGRNVTIRPEMTPTVARMVAQKRKELSFPLRWFSIPNLFRYERPQRGRLREHWQLNADIFGVEGIEADVEVISLAYSIMKGFGAKDDQFEIKINSRRLLNYLLGDIFALTAEAQQAAIKLLDRSAKITKEELQNQARQIFNNQRNEEIFVQILKSGDLGLILEDKMSPEKEELRQVLANLKNAGINNARFDLSIARGFDYYTGVVFEVFDTNKVNPRALFGGGRYDDLVGIFGVEKVSGVGFGMGDVTIRDFLETYNLLPEYQPPIKLYICHLEGFVQEANKLGAELRAQGVNVAVDLSDRKVSGQVKTADKELIPYILVVGEEEVKSGKFKLKNLKESKEQEVSREKIAQILK